MAMQPTETKQGFYKISGCVFFLIAKPPTEIFYSTARRKLKHSVMVLEERAGKPWNELEAEGFIVMKVYADLVDRTFNVKEEYENWNRNTWVDDCQREGVA